MRHRIHVVILVALFALIVSGCEMRAVTSIAVEEGGSGSIGFVVAMDEELRELLSESGMGGDAEVDFSDPEFWTDSILEMGDDAPEGMEAVPYEDGDFLGVEVTVPFASPEDLAALGGDDQFGPGELPALTVDGNTYRLVIPVDASDFTEGMDDIPLSAGDIFEVSYLADLPGEITETNGTVDADDPSRVSWELDLDDPTEFGAELHVTSVSGGIAWWLVAAGAVALLVVGIALGYRRTMASDASRRGEQEHAAGDPAPASETV